MIKCRGHIIKKYVPIINDLINQYLQQMDFFVSFHLDEEFNETVKSFVIEIHLITIVLVRVKN